MKGEKAQAERQKREMRKRKRKRKKEKESTSAAGCKASDCCIGSGYTVCKHEGALLWSWQKAAGGGKNENTERETNGKWSGATL